MFGSFNMIGRPLTVMPLASTSSRVASISGPWLLVPSPETSITRLMPLKGLCSNRPVAKMSAPDGCRVQRLHESAGGFRPVDHLPGHDDLLLVDARPFDIGDGNAAVRPL